MRINVIRLHAECLLLSQMNFKLLSSNKGNKKLSKQIGDTFQGPKTTAVLQLGEIRYFDNALLHIHVHSFDSYIAPW